MENKKYYLSKAKRIFNEVKKDVIGKNEEICKVMMAVLAKGNILIDDIPGVGKTTMTLSFAKAMDLKCNRVQFTPDVMPSDILGFNMFNKATNQFEFKEGAANCNILLADEINRTSPKTQSALLQVMEENAITVEGKIVKLPDPFIVMATQNPLGSIGTQKLPESQLDRFMIKISMGYPSFEDEVLILKNNGFSKERIKAEKAVGIDELLSLIEYVNDIYVDDSIYGYIARIAEKTRKSEYIIHGISPRGGIAVLAMAKSFAFLRGHDYVLPSDVVSVLADTVCHRLVLNRDFGQTKNKAKDILDSVVKEVEAPKLNTKENDAAIIW